MKKIIFLASLFTACTFLFANMIYAQTADCETPSVELICTGERGAAYGLCVSYCEAMDCDSVSPNANQSACDVIRSKYVEMMGREIACDVQDFSRFSGTYSGAVPELPLRIDTIDLSVSGNLMDGFGDGGWFTGCPVFDNTCGDNPIPAILGGVFSTNLSGQIELSFSYECQGFASGFGGAGIVTVTQGDGEIGTIMEGQLTSGVDCGFPLMKIEDFPPEWSQMFVVKEN